MWVPDLETPGAEVNWQFSLEIRYLEGQGDLVSRLIMQMARVTIWVIGVVNLLTKSP